MGWDDIQPGGGGGDANFLTLKGGQSAKFHVLLAEGHPLSYKSVFFPAIKRSAVLPEDGGPLAGMEKEYGVRKRHAVIVFDLGDKKIKILEMSNTVANALKGIYTEYGNLDEVDLKLSREGDDMNTTKYQLIPIKLTFTPDLVEGMDQPSLETIFAPTDDAKIQQMMAGQLPDEEATPPADAEETTDAPAEETPSEEPTEGEPENPEDETPPAPKGKATPPAKPAPAKPAPKAPPSAKAPAPANGSAQRSTLLMAAKANFAKLKRYRVNPKLQLADIKKFGGADKVSLSQLGIDHMQKLVNFQKTQK